MKIIFKVLIGFLNLIYCLFKMLPVKDKVTFISRQADRPTEDIQLLGKALEAADPHMTIESGPAPAEWTTCKPKEDRAAQLTGRPGIVWAGAYSRVYRMSLRRIAANSSM